MAERIIANLTLDTYQRNKIPPLVIPQHDYGARYIRVRITEQGENVSVASGSVVSIIAKRMADGQSTAFSGSVNADGSVLVPVTQWMLDAPSDDVDCHVAVTGTGYQYSTTSFVISPQERENPSYLEEDDPRVNIVEEALIKVVEEADRAEEQADLAQSAASTAASDAKEAARQEVEQLVGQLGIVQTLGNSRMAVVSQAVTTGLYNRNAKRIANLEQGFNEQFETDDSVAYVKDVPENALPYAEVKRVGGMTYKDGDTLRSAKVTEVESVGVNLLNPAEIRDGYYNVANNGAFVASDWKASPFIPCFPLTPYTASHAKFETYGYWNFYDVNKNHIGYEEMYRSTTVTTPNGCCYLTFYARFTGDVMLNSGSTALPYRPYLHHTLPIPVEVRGSMNLFDIEKREFGTFDDNGDLCLDHEISDFYKFEAKENTQYTLSAYVKNANTTGNGRFRVLYTDGSEDNPVLLNTGTDWAYRSHTTKAGKTVKQIQTYYGDLGAWFIKGGELMINEGTTALPYEPYGITGLDGYGWGVSDTVYNYIDWEKKQFVKRVGKVDLGTLYWTLIDGAFIAEAVILGYKYGMNGICAKYMIVNNANTDKSLYMRDSYFGNHCIGVRDSAYTDAITFKAAMSGVMLVYELATPEVTDISNLITEDNVIGVEGNGTLTFKNAYEYAVPSEVEYQVEV